MTDLQHDPLSRRRHRMADVSVAEAAAAHADGANVFVTRIDGSLIEAVERVGWALDHIAEGAHPDGRTVFCVFVRSPLAS